MGKLSSEQRRTVVIRLARFDEPPEILADLKAEGVTVSRQALAHYDPTTAGSQLNDNLRELFELTRQEYLEGMARIGISHKTHQMAILQRGVAYAQRVNNWVLVKDLLETAAKILGDAFRKSLEVKHSGLMGVEHSGGFSVDREPSTKAERDAVLKEAGVL